MRDLIDRKDIIDEMENVDWYHQNQSMEMVHGANSDDQAWYKTEDVYEVLERMPSVQPEKEIPKRVRWSGWKGTRYTRYYCPNCEKAVRNDDYYCHRCGQRLTFPKVTFTDYVPGKKQQTIITWEDEDE